MAALQRSVSKSQQQTPTTAPQVSASGVANSDVMGEMSGGDMGMATPMLDAAGGGAGHSHTTYTVKSGDSLGAIAARFGTTVGAIAAASGISNPDFISIGQVLTIPGSSGGSSGGSGPSTGTGTSTGGAGTSTGGTQTATGGESGSTTYTVKSGDSLSAIASVFGTTVAAISSANGIVNPNLISVGQVLTIPAGGQTGPGTSGPGTSGPGTSGPGTSGPGTSGPGTSGPGTSTGTGNVDLSTEINAQALQQVTSSVIGVAPQSAGEYAASAIPGILRQCAASGMRIANQVAYILATTEHESNFGKPKYSRSETLVEDTNPIRSNGNGSYSAKSHLTGRTHTGSSREEVDRLYWNDAYGSRSDLGNRSGTNDGRDFKGRGYVQLTGRANYIKMTDILNSEGFSYTIDGTTYGGSGNAPIDLVSNPTHVNRVPDLAARVMIEGSMRGSFTGKSLDDYISDSNADFYNARTIINGDKAKNGESIAATARKYAGVLGGWSSVFQAQS